MNESMVTMNIDIWWIVEVLTFYWIDETAEFDTSVTLNY